jgi:hypothetical protein
MQHHQQALAMLRYSLGDIHVHVAETMYQIGNLHTSQGLYHLAHDSFVDDLRIYQWNHCLVNVTITLVK